ncbi:hypothetical protein HR45_00395 [Shewanella mangrovi]|uniref:VWFA domain-containing protein n=1 Tax=Shewanella mangrovi TaxID=1515746 RepID=A0A094K2L8_9GAMM|nr:VWA domain-containing protein [Shewanella mangrovi]KFZ38901.1 hypothetical protein HR45_00395 [Shewanella mangrovi]
MSLTLLHPWSGLLLLALPLIWWMGRSLPRLQRGLRCALVALLAVALMQPVWIHQSQQQFRVLIIDQSASLTDEAKGQAVTWLTEQLSAQADNEQIAVVQLGGEALHLAQQAITYLPDNSSSLTAAVMQALALIPANSAARVSVVSDGLATDDHWPQVIAALQLRHIPLDWLSLQSKPAAPFIAQVQATPVRIGEMPQLNVQLEGNASSDASLTLTAQTNGAVVAQQTFDPKRFNEPQPVTVTLTLPAATQAYQQITLQLQRNGDNGNTQRLDEREWLLAAQPAYSLLYANSDASAAAKLQQLLGATFKVQAATLPLDESTDFGRYDVVMLDDLPSQALSEAAQKRLQQAVAQGTGLFYSGADNAFASATLAKQTLAELLPVKLQQQEQQREPSVSLAIVIDSSGSMKGRPMELAKQVARLAVKKLKPQDQVGIVEFYGTRQWAVPMQAVENPKEIERAIGRMQAQGGSELFPAIQEAYFGLKNSHTRYRHILLITDAAVEEDNYQRLLRFIAQDQINVSAVMVGDSQGGEQRMAELANWGRGRFYAIHDEFNMVELNFHRPSSEPQPVYQTGHYQVQGPNGQLLPQPLSGFAQVQSKAAAQVQYQVSASAQPLLSHWRVGAGSVTAMMFSPLGASTAGWQQWPGYGQWLGQQLSANADPLAPMQLYSSRSDDQLQIQLQLSDNQAPAPTLMWKPNMDATWQPLALVQRAPNRYSASLSLPNQQSALLQAQLHGQVLRAVAAAGSDHAAELKVPHRFASLLAQVVQAVGGQVSSVEHMAAKKLSPVASASLTATHLYPLCLLFALLLYFIEIIYRRWPTRRAVVSGL